MKLTVIANPRAGRGRVQRFLGPFRSRVRALGQPVDLLVTESAGHGTELARSAAQSSDIICVVGGDGTVHEVANGLMPDPVPLVVIPCGSGDDFAKLVGCPRDADELVSVLADGSGVMLDVLDGGDRYCINSCGLGFEAQVTKNSRSIQRLKGLPLYLLALGKALAEHHCPDLTITLDNGEVIAGPRLLVSVGNGVSAGGGFFLTPDAVPDDGLIDVCVVEKMGRIKMLGLLPLSLKGTHTTRREVQMRRTRSVTVESAGPLHMHIDGEYLGDQRRSTTFTVLDRRLPVLCKKDAPGLFSQTPQTLLD
jgi:YegS/Rv2252/BmrU family lipid kinase